MVRWLQYAGEVGKCRSYWWQIFWGFNAQKSLKSFNFRVIWKIKRWTFLGHSVYINIHVHVLLCTYLVQYVNCTYTDLYNLLVRHEQDWSLMEDNVENSCRQNWCSRQNREKGICFTGKQKQKTMDWSQFVAPSRGPLTDSSGGLYGWQNSTRMKQTTGWCRIHQTIQPFNRVYENLHKIAPFTL